MKRSLYNSKISSAEDFLNICDVAGTYVKPVEELACELDIDRNIPNILRGVRSVWYTDKNNTKIKNLINPNCNQCQIFIMTVIV